MGLTGMSDKLKQQTRHTTKQDCPSISLCLQHADAFLNPKSDALAPDLNPVVQ